MMMMLKITQSAIPVIIKLTPVRILHSREMFHCYSGTAIAKWINIILIMYDSGNVPINASLQTVNLLIQAGLDHRFTRKPRFLHVLMAVMQLCTEVNKLQYQQKHATCTKMGLTWSSWYRKLVGISPRMILPKMVSPPGLADWAFSTSEAMLADDALFLQSQLLLRYKHLRKF